MKIQIIDFDRNHAEAIFKTDLGNGKGIWMNDVPPKIGDSYEVELELTEPLEINVNVAIVDDISSFIDYNKLTFVCQGQVQNVDEDGLVILKLGDSLLLLDDFSETPSVGTTIRISTKDVRLYDSNI